MLDQWRETGSKFEKKDEVLDLKEQMLLVLFGQLSDANQDRVIRCADVLFQIQEE